MSMYISDLHIHSRFSRATSRDGDPQHLDLWARKKGIHIVGTGDFTHPAWRSELEEKLEPAEDGLYKLKKMYRIKDGVASDSMEPRFVITGEISSIYKKNGRTRKVHNLLILPGLEAARTLSAKLETIGNIHSDGRPILGLDCKDLLEIFLERVPGGIFVPAHIWTPHFSLLGAFSGFDSVKECFEDLTPWIHAMETGLSSDPAMNWRLSMLDGYQLISNSDAHSPAKLGREANLMDIELSYAGLEKAIQKGDGLYGTVEFFPEEGKYHYDGHRKCQLCLTPEQTKAFGGRCPVCGRKLTIGVEHRVEELADREMGYVRQDAKPFESLMPLPEAIGEAIGHAPASRIVQNIYAEMLKKLGSEFEILRQIPVEDIRKQAGYMVAEGIRRLRNGEVERDPGFDGEYGKIHLFRPEEREDTQGQLNFFSWLDIPEKRTEVTDGERQAEAALQAAETPKPTDAVWTEETDTMTNSHKDILNEMQEGAVRSVAPVTAVIAGPGTGKTKTLVEKIRYLIQVRRVRPDQITAVTFTNKAAGEMRERLGKALSGVRGAKQLQIGTFHALCLDMLRRGNVPVHLVDETQTRELAESVIADYGMKMTVSQFLNGISFWKNGASARSVVCREAYEVYQDLMEKRQMTDFDDLLKKTLEWMDTGSGKAVKGGHFQYLLVDEFQDIQPLQYQLIQKWHEGGRELFVIGDPDQSIYGFRGSDARCFERLEKDHPDMTTLRLMDNYRSRSPIVDAAMAVISANPGKKRMLRAARTKGEPVRIVKASGAMAQAIFVAKEINRQVGGMDMLDAETDRYRNETDIQRDFADIGILYRTHYEGRLLEKCLRQESIPYVVAGRDDYLTAPAVRGTLCFFRSLMEDLPEDMKLAGQLLWEQEPGMTDMIYEQAAETYRPLLKKTKPEKLLIRWMDDMGLQNDENMDKLVQTAVFYKTMEALIYALMLGEEGDILRRGGKKYKSGAVTLMTMHAAKGLEFPLVFLYDVKKGRIPLERPEGETDMEEERRLFFVAMTRAKDELILTYDGEGSAFLDDIPEALSVYEKAGRQKEETEEVHQMDLFELWEEK